LAARRRQLGQSRTNGAPKAAKLPWLDHESEPIVNDRWVTVSSLRRSAVADIGFNHEMSRRIGAIRRRGSMYRTIFLLWLAVMAIFAADVSYLGWDLIAVAAGLR
jgi:hypothetical protein